MAQIYPFQAWRYAPDRVPIAQVVTQPYDKITPEMQKRYYRANPSNLVRIILGERRPEDCQENVYSRAATSFRDWRSTGDLFQDSQPSIYCYLQNFTVPGSDKQIERQGFIALGRLENYSTKVVFPHE